MGIVQGLSEFLPISSSAHLVFTSNFYKIFKGLEIVQNSNEEVFFDILVHLGTLIAVLIYFRKDILNILKAMYNAVKTKNWENNEAKLGLYIIVGTLLTIVLALPLNKVAEKLVFSPAIVGVLLFFTGFTLLYSEYKSKKAENKKSEIFMGGLRPYAPTWEEALKYCNEQTLAGISNWRLPNINELMFFLFHIGGGNSSYWSSTTYAEDPSGSWIFKYGSSISAEPKNSSQDNIIVLCVADAPCEKGLAWTGTDCVNFCDPNPCKEMEHSNGKCELNFYSKLDKDSFICGCNEEEGAFWNFWQEKCVTPCEPNPCENYEHSNGVCTIHKELPTYPDNIQEYSYYCGCDEPYYWVDRQIGCVNGCIPNHCENVEHSTGGCYPGDLGWYSCECEEGYEWDWSDSCVSICDDGYLWDGFQCAPVCEPNRCEYIEHTTGECYQTGSNMFGCDCEEGYHWAYFDCEKDPEED